MECAAAWYDVCFGILPDDGGNIFSNADFDCRTYGGLGNNSPANGVAPPIWIGNIFAGSAFFRYYSNAVSVVGSNVSENYRHRTPRPMVDRQYFYRCRTVADPSANFLREDIKKHTILGLVRYCEVRNEPLKPS